VIDPVEVMLALRARASGASIATTGSTTLVATTAGYTRAAGSFLTDGFAAGMLVTPSGFTQTTTGVITQVTASAMTISGGRTAQASGSGRTLAALLPPVAYVNTEYEPTTGQPYVEEDYQPQPSELLGMSTGGSRQEFGLYVLRCYGPIKVGVSALYGLASALLALFPAGLGLTLASGDQLNVRDLPAPWAGPVRTDDKNNAVITVTIPFRVFSPNT
jgi:hypothetical protein